MHASTLNMVRPGRILLVTDLSARCHLALDRAARLAAEWQIAWLVVKAALTRYVQCQRGEGAIRGQSGDTVVAGLRQGEQGRCRARAAPLQAVIEQPLHGAVPAQRAQRNEQHGGQQTRRASK
jgi:hypothetical protein